MLSGNKYQRCLEFRVLFRVLISIVNHFQTSEYVFKIHLSTLILPCLWTSAKPRYARSRTSHYVVAHKFTNREKGNRILCPQFVVCSRNMFGISKEILQFSGL